MLFRRVIKYISIFFIPVVLVGLLIGVLNPNTMEKFNANGFDISAIMNHIEILTSPEFQGRQPGTPGNEKSIRYIENELKKNNVKPFYPSGYRQNFDVVVANINPDSKFVYTDGSNRIHQFKGYEDFRYSVNGESAPIDFLGDVIVLNSSIFAVSEEYLKDRIIVIRVAEMTDKIMDYGIKCGAKGLFYCTEESESSIKTKSSNLSGKDGREFPTVSISKKMFGEIRESAGKFQLIHGTTTIQSVKLDGVVIGVIPKVEIKQDIQYNPITTANVIGVIEGKKKDAFLIVSSHFDHSGMAHGSKYYPGALDNASGTAMALDLSRWCNATQTKPEKTILFIFFNAEEVGLVGSRHYVKHPAVPLKHSEVINLDMIGGNGPPRISVLSDTKIKSNQIMMSRFEQYGTALGIDIKTENSGGSDHQAFTEMGEKAIMINQGMQNYHTFDDTIDNMSSENMTLVGKLLGQVIKRDYYGDRKIDFLNLREKAVIAFILLLCLTVYCTEQLYRRKGSFNKQSITIEKIYYSLGYGWIKKCLQLTIPLLGLFMLIFISQLPRDLNIVEWGGGLISNFSLYITLKGSVFYLRTLIINLFGGESGNWILAQTIQNALPKTLWLMGSATIVSLVVGTTKGIFDAYKGKKHSGLSSLFFLSVPDVLWIFFANMFMIWSSNTVILSQILSYDLLKNMVFPLITLSIMPTVYLSRVSYVAAQSELKQPYVVALRARGASKGRIFKKYLLAPVVQKTVASMVGLISVMISNLIIVEYLFDYKGLASAILRADVVQDRDIFISLMICICLLYLVFTSLLKLWNRAMQVR